MAEAQAAPVEKTNANESTTQQAPETKEVKDTTDTTEKKEDGSDSKAEEKVGEKRKADDEPAGEVDEKKWVDPLCDRCMLICRAKTTEETADKGKGKGKGKDEEPVPELEATVDEDDEDPEDLIISRPRRRAKVDYTSVSVALQRKPERRTGRFELRLMCRLRLWKRPV